MKFRRWALCAGMVTGLSLQGCAGPGIYHPPWEESSPPASSQVPVIRIPIEGDAYQEQTGAVEESGALVIYGADNGESIAGQAIPGPETRIGWADTGEATYALIASARTQAAAGNFPAASSTLERAQRVSPRSAYVYYELANLRLQQGNPVAAEQMALKAQALAGSDPEANSLIWLLIADIREAQGDLDGAEAARLRAEALLS